MMTKGEILTRATIWLTIAGYAVGATTLLLSQRRCKWDKVARLAWTVALMSLSAHVVCAFHFYHDWSHAAAYRDTARQTAEVFGIDWGGGLYVNYALLACWVTDVAWWWGSGLDAYRHRPRLLMAAWHAFLIFIIFNATVVFGTGLTRWIGVCVCLGVSLVWLLKVWSNSRRRSD
jgi:hypothetical protein